MLISCKLKADQENISASEEEVMEGILLVKKLLLANNRWSTY